MRHAEPERGREVEIVAPDRERHEVDVPGMAWTHHAPGAERARELERRTARGARDLAGKSHDGRKTTARRLFRSANTNSASLGRNVSRVRTFVFSGNDLTDSTKLLAFSSCTLPRAAPRTRELSLHAPGVPALKISAGTPSPAACPR